MSRHGVRHFDRNVPNATKIVGLPAVDGLFALGVTVGEKFQIDTYLGCLRKRMSRLIRPSSRPALRANDARSTPG